MGSRESLLACCQGWCDMCWMSIYKNMQQTQEVPQVTRRRRAPPPTDFHVTNFLADIMEKHNKHENTLYDGISRKIKKGEWPPTWSQELVEDMQPYYEYKMRKQDKKQ